MATLEGLLALLPDNNTGRIDAADLRDIVSSLWDKGDTETAARVAGLAAKADQTALDQAVAELALKADSSALDQAVAALALKANTADLGRWRARS